VSKLGLFLAGLATAGCGSEATTSPDPVSGIERGSALIATGATADRRELQLRVIQDDGGPCLLVVGIDAQVRGCGRARLQRKPPITRDLVAEATVVRKGATHREIFAATSGRVARVRLRADGKWLASRRSVLLRADGARRLEHAGIDSGPFGYFFAEVPRKARAIRVVAFDARGDRIGTADFDDFMAMGELFVSG
jgi:hypothetical protein